MPHIKCKEPKCPHYITDPCVKLEGLFLIREDLFAEKERNPKDTAIQKKLEQLDELIQSQLGVSENKISSLSVNMTGKRAVKNSNAMLFTLTCLLGHRHQYFITCES